MPKQIEEALKKQAKKMIQNGKMSKKSGDAYVYGTLRKTGWKPKK